MRVDCEGEGDVCAAALSRRPLRPLHLDHGPNHRRVILPNARPSFSCAATARVPLGPPPSKRETGAGTLQRARDRDSLSQVNVPELCFAVALA